jgi:hypothetical protein
VRWLGKKAGERWHEIDFFGTFLYQDKKGQRERIAASVEERNDFSNSIVKNK